MPTGVEGPVTDTAKTRGGWIVCGLLALGGCRADASAPPDTGTVETTAPVAVDGSCAGGLPEGARCGTVTVFENRASGEGRTIDLAYTVLPARTKDGAQPDPVFVLAGGPGQAATQITVLANASLKGVNESRALVFVDQRGTGASNGLHCAATTLDDLLQGPWAEQNQGMVAECAASLPADLAQYATPSAMDDLDDVRQALGYDQINLWGGSYGTRAGLAYVRQHEEHVRSAALWGVAPPGRPFPRTFGPSGQAALERLMTDCGADEGCRALLPDGLATVDRIMARLDETPAQLKVKDPRDGAETSITLTREGFAGGLRLALYDASWSAALPMMLAAADRGDFQPMMQLVVPLTVGILTQIHFGMFLSVACAEDVPLLTAADDEAARKTFVGEKTIVGLREACEQWPTAELPADYLSPVRSEVPVLLMAGELDPVTPPATAHAAAEQLSRSVVVPFPNVGHGTSNAGSCEEAMLRRFFETADPTAVDVGCTQSLQRPPFVIPGA